MSTPPLPELSRLRRAARSMRVRLALASAAAAALALLGTGAFVVTSVDRSERASLDRTLVSRASRAATVARDALRGPAARARPAAAGTTPPLLGPADQRLGDDVAVVRIVGGNRVIERLGSIADPGLPTAAGAAPATVDAGGQPWRIVEQPIGSGLSVQAAAPLAPVRQRADRLRNRVAVAGLAGVLATLALAFLLVGAVLRALGRLRRTAAEVAATADLSTRVDADDGPQEVREVSATLNAMLARLQAADLARLAALDATRRFASDAGHELRTPLATIGAGVQTLAGHPNLDPEDRAAAFADVLAEHRRAVALLDALQALARGDGADHIDHEPADLVDLAEAAIANVKAEAPRARIDLHAPPELVREIWAPGIRIAVDNLIRNAVRHGRPDAQVLVTLTEQADAVVITVDDDGPGIPADECSAVRERFARGRHAQGPGSGLGLALVDQQATLHRGALELSTSPLGGLRATLQIGP